MYQGELCHVHTEPDSFCPGTNRPSDHRCNNGDFRRNFCKAWFSYDADLAVKWLQVPPRLRTLSYNNRTDRKPFGYSSLYRWNAYKVASGSINTKKYTKYREIASLRSRVARCCLN